MLNHSTTRQPSLATRGRAGTHSVPSQLFPDAFCNDWSVGGESARWDVPFTVRLLKELKRLVCRREVSDDRVGSREVTETTPAPAAVDHTTPLGLRLVTEDSPHQQRRQAA